MIRRWHRYYLFAAAAPGMEGNEFAEAVNATPQGFVLRSSAERAAYFYESTLKLRPFVRFYVRPVTDAMKKERAHE